MDSVWPYQSVSALFKEQTRVIKKVFSVDDGALKPVFERIVDNRSQHQAITNTRRASEVEHVNGLQCGMSIT